ncbi:hypothetical protein ETU09_06005 [Apibacter muscae]|uniref:WG repeat-containing protein n=1 Tax=Apibacter muscae TaxID=2509004 RepID=A0A563DFC8_9FLAO|nr:hypothetical protein [Apibacter muscae]TWP28474.1 hypothetical protein ETU09_06005 [Apibacter muscae]
MRNLIVFFNCFFSLLLCSQTYIDKKGVERLDKENYKNRKNGEYYHQKDGDYIRIKDSTKISFYLNSFQIREIPPKPNIFYREEKKFYPTGILKSKEEYFGPGYEIKTGKSQYYNKKGKLIKEVDEEAKFGAIKPQDIINFLDREGYINKQTGEIGINSEGEKYDFIEFEFNPASKLWDIYIEGGREYTPREIEKIEELSTIKNEDGSLGYDNYLFPDSYTYTYEIDGETGKVLSNNLALDPRDVFKTYQGKEYTRRQWRYYRNQHHNQLLEEGEYFGDKEEPYPVQKRKETP